jgi:hypothetical protein
MEVHEKGMMESFTLFRLRDFKERVMRIKKMDARKEVRMWQTDIACMFTHLSKQSILKRVSELIEMYQIIYRGKPLGVSVEKKAPWKCYRGTNTGVDDVISLTFDDIKRIVLFDLSSTYSRYGDMFFYQREGIPIGGMCSSIYADIQCGFDEYNYMLTNGVKENTLLAIRQIDDMLIITADESEKERVVNCYDDALELTPEQVQEDKNGSQKGIFIGLEVMLKCGVVKSKVHNVNMKRIRIDNKQEKPRFVPKQAMRGAKLLKQTISGTLYRVRDYSIGGVNIVEGITEFEREFRVLGYPNGIFESVLKDFIRRKVPKSKRRAWVRALRLIRKI